VHGSLAFYTDYFWRKSQMSWATASLTAEKFVPLLQGDWPDYLEEIKGRFLTKPCRAVSMLRVCQESQMAQISRSARFWR
jgi:hypothetical protein